MYFLKVLTAESMLRLVSLQDAESEEDEIEPEVQPESLGRGKRTAVIDQKLRQDTTAEEKRKKHQR